VKKTKTILLAAASSLALTSAASAMDRPMWQGPYWGLNFGAIWNDADASGYYGDPFSTSVNPASFTFGGQIGYNWQYNNFVYGLETDLNWADASKTRAFTDSGGYSSVFHSKLSWLATFRGRWGVTIAPPTLLYITGGLAAGGIRNDLPDMGISMHETRWGWTLGGGIEHQYSLNWSTKIEVLYFDLGDKTFNNSGYVGRFDNTGVIARLGLNYKW
jgi:outer membrane immunogenic protein